MRTLAERLKAEREAAGLTQEDLAKKSNTGQSMIGNLESGLRKGSAKLPNIAAALGLHALWLKEERGPKHLDAGQTLQHGIGAVFVAHPTVPGAPDAPPLTFSLGAPLTDPNTH